VVIVVGVVHGKNGDQARSSTKSVYFKDKFLALPAVALEILAYMPACG